MDDGEEEEYQNRKEGAQEQLDSYAIPDEDDQMGIPDAMRFEQAQRKKGQETQGQRQESGGQEEKGYEPSATSDKTNENSIENASIEISDIEKSEQPHNYVIDIHNQETGGEKARYKWNVEAVRTLKQVEAEGRNATPEEQEILARYAGWGGTSQAFDEKSERWQKEYAELKELLTPEEYREARATVTTAFYTPPEIAAAVGNALVQFGFQGGNVLEPSMGTGHFFGTMPGAAKGSSFSV